MPREVKAYACIYRCGVKVVLDPKAMAKHELNCFANLARRACKTCRHDHKRPDPEDCYCEWDIHEQDDRLLRRVAPNGTAITCRADCPDWEQK